MDIWVEKEQNFMSHPNWDVFSFGNPPVAIYIIAKVKGLDFPR